MASTTEITLEQLASVDAKILFKALEMRLASAGVLKKRGKKASKASSADGEDSASQASREQPEKVKEWQSLMSEINTVYKRLLSEAGEKFVAGSHFKVSALVKKNLLAAGREPSSFTEEDVRAAKDFLSANPDHKSETQERRASKSSGSEDESSAGAGGAAKKPVVVVKSSTAASSASAAKPSADEKKAAREAEKAAKKAAAEAEKAAKKAAAEAEKAAKKAAKDAEKAASKKAKTAKKPAEAAPAEAEAEAEASDDLAEIEFDGVSYFWNSGNGNVYENIDGHCGMLYGTWSGEGDIVPSE